MRLYQAIAALSENGVIGAGNSIPWRIPEDFKWFKQTTMGGILLMGRKTFESIGRPLPGRETIVLTRSGVTFPGARSVSSWEEFQGLTADDPRPVWICGGAEIYRLLLPLCDGLILSRIHRVVEGDAYFPEFEGEFEKTAELLRTPEFHVESYRRRAAVQ